VAHATVAYTPPKGRKVSAGRGGRVSAGGEKVQPRKTIQAESRTVNGQNEVQKDKDEVQKDKEEIQNDDAMQKDQANKENSAPSGTTTFTQGSEDERLQAWWLESNGMLPNAHQEREVAKKLGVTQFTLRAFILKSL
jgi:hypothetical protein